jgi:hypothetical protein
MPLITTHNCFSSPHDTLPENGRVSILAAQDVWMLSMILCINNLLPDATLCLNIPLNLGPQQAEVEILQIWNT